jgi:hypothetical protein
MVEVIRFHRAFQLAVHLIGQGGIAQPPAPAIAGPDLGGVSNVDIDGNNTL